ncbi:MAG: AAA family ATPase [Syntrophales bacterium]|nr:AAA family ATPase [Syntrophales bacterium]
MHLNTIQIDPARFPVKDGYPFHLKIFQETKRIDLKSPVTFFIGENGTGKSTLLQAVCRKAGVHIWKSSGRTRFNSNPHEETLYKYIDIRWTKDPVPGSYFGSDIFRDFTLALDEWAAADPGQLNYFGGKSLVSQSHGQSLMSYFKSRYKIPGIYFLDEPETALSPRSQLEFLELMAEMAEAGHAQFIVATHSPLLLACPGADILSFDNIPVRPIRYEDTEYYRIYRDFLSDPESWLKPGSSVKRRKQ